MLEELVSATKPHFISVQEYRAISPIKTYIQNEDLCRGHSLYNHLQLS